VLEMVQFHRHGIDVASDELRAVASVHAQVRIGLHQSIRRCASCRSLFRMARPLLFPAPHYTNSTCAGKNKSNLSNKSSRIKPESRTDDLFAHLREFEEWANPAFNVLIVQTPRPKFFESPILKAFRGTIKETGVSRMAAWAAWLHVLCATPGLGADSSPHLLLHAQELLKSILRFGLPETSVRNKLPFWRCVPSEPNDFFPRLFACWVLSPKVSALPHPPLFSTH
jgi:hypothetical protein